MNSRDEVFIGQKNHQNTFNISAQKLDFQIPKETLKL